MTRDQQILEASINAYGIDVRSVNSCGKAFCDGADWADSHPNWHKVKIGDNMLCLPEKANGHPYNVILPYCDEVLHGRFFGNMWVVEGHDYSVDCVKYWIELPKLPDETKKETLIDKLNNV